MISSKDNNSSDSSDSSGIIKQVQLSCIVSWSSDGSLKWWSSKEVSDDTVNRHPTLLAEHRCRNYSILCCATNQNDVIIAGSSSTQTMGVGNPGWVYVFDTDKLVNSKTYNNNIINDGSSNNDVVAI